MRPENSQSRIEKTFKCVRVPAYGKMYGLRNKCVRVLQTAAYAADLQLVVGNTPASAAK